MEKLSFFHLILIFIIRKLNSCHNKFKFMQDHVYILYILYNLILILLDFFDIASF